MNMLPVAGYYKKLNFLSSEKVSFLKEKIFEKFLNEYNYDTSHDESSYDYTDLVSSKNSILITRKGVSGSNYDKGMIDIFNPQYSIPEINVEFLNLEKIDKILNQKNFKLKNFNIYISRGVTTTRGTHYDGEKQYKIFFYLTDVINKSDGPYSYVPYSQLFLLLFRLSSFLKRLFFNSYYSKDISLFNIILKKMYGNAGTLILSNQEGLHRGTSQSPKGNRIMLVANYMK